MHASSQVQPLARVRGLTKRFGPVTVLQDVDLDIFPGEVHVLAGENGAGKSTLIRILGGIYPDAQGRIELNGVPVRPGSPVEAGNLGIALIHQELSLVGPLSVADNIFLGRTPARAGLVQDSVLRREAARCLSQLGLDLDVRQPVENFPVGIRQLVEIAKALSQNARLFIMDEPTSALTAPEVERLFALIRELKDRGCALVYITHKMEEIWRIADRITVLRDGRRIGSAPAPEVSPELLIRWMVGRDLGEQFPRHRGQPGPERLRLQDFSVSPRGAGTRPAVDRVSFAVRSGEVVGLAGLQGSGASELFHGVFGSYGRNTSGELRLDGHPARIQSPRAAIAAGIALLTNDRKATGLVLSLSVTANTTLSRLPALSPWGWRRPPREQDVTRQVMSALQLRAASLDLEVGALSGGNQQKVALGKWLLTRPRLLLLDEPTRGVDVGAKREIYEHINAWTREGMAILLITSEMPELLALSDRILTLHRGRITAEFSHHNATPEAILRAAMGEASQRL